MKNFYLPIIIAFICSSTIQAQLKATNTLLLNFGSNTCAGTSAQFSVIEKPFESNQTVKLNCDLSATFSSISGISMSFNKIDQKAYFFNSSSRNLRSYDLGLPANLACASTLPLVRTFTNPPNNFEFGPNGNIWTLGNLDISTGQALIQSVNPSTGAVAISHNIQFPLNHLPSTLASGDISILPNQRFFAVFKGPNSTSIGYEITGYQQSNITAVANYLLTIPANIYGMAYVNGKLIFTGRSSTTACYYYSYDIDAKTLSSQMPYSLGRPADNAKITGAIGAAKILTNETFVSNNSRRLTYRVFVKNIGDVTLRVKAAENLQRAFPGASISNVSTTIADGSASGVVLNTAYNGTTDTLLISNNFQLSNIAPNNLIMIDVTFTAANLNPATTYYNNSIALGEFGSTASPVKVADLSNWGDTATIDLNYNGDAGDTNENIPVPWKISTMNIAGTIWADADNSANGTFSNIYTDQERGTNGGGLYAILVSIDANKVIASTAVQNNGTYSFTGVSQNTDVKVVLSTTTGIIVKSK